MDRKMPQAGGNEHVEVATPSCWLGSPPSQLRVVCDELLDRGGQEEVVDDDADVVDDEFIFCVPVLDDILLIMTMSILNPRTRMALRISDIDSLIAGPAAGRCRVQAQSSIQRIIGRF